MFFDQYKMSLICPREGSAKVPNLGLVKEALRALLTGLGGGMWPL